MLGVDPAPAMLDQVPSDPRLPRLVATAEQFANGQPTNSRYDAILLKEAIHHVQDRPNVIRRLAGRLVHMGDCSS